MTQANELPEGEIVSGKFRIERVLGEGGMAVVYRAQHVDLDEPVALKFLRPDALLRPDIVKRFQQEARAAVKLKSEHVARVSDHAQKGGVKIHLHRCRQVEVAVTFNRETVNRRFAPGAPVARVKHWAAVKKFGMTEDEAGEHVLQIAGTHDRPNPGTHIGGLTDSKTCALAFDLVPDERINGAFQGDR